MVEAYDCALEKKQVMCICHLSKDILQIILKHLSILDYISCRAVSKCWRLAFLLSSEETYFSQAHQHQPWFALLDTNHSLDHPGLFSATSKLGNLADKSTMYDFDMPELRGTNILLSKYGWLLLNSSWDLFFFHIFSRTRIAAPNINVAKMLSPIFDISAPPTSPDCTLFSVALYLKSNGLLDCEVKCWSYEDLSWSPEAIESFVFDIPGADFAFVVKENRYCVRLNRPYSVIDVANVCLKPVSGKSGLPRREKESLEVVLVEPTGLTLPPTRVED